jgi:DNA processing protein
MIEAACPRCLARAWLTCRLAGHLELARAGIQDILALADDELIDALAGKERETIRRELVVFDAAAAQARCRQAGVETLCRCHPDYPPGLRDLEAPPSVLHVAGGLPRFLELAAGEPVAVVGARRGSDYGLEVARSLGRGLATASMVVISGMALGVDCAAHAGVLEAGGATVAVLAGSAHRPYPRARRAMHARIVATGAVVSELPPGSRVWRWMFPARNRLIAALAALTVVVEAGEGSGALLTAELARGLGRPVGAVPGRVTTALATGPNHLLAAGAHVIRGPQDVLDAVFGAGMRTAAEDRRPPLQPGERALLAAVADCDDTAAALARSGLGTEDGLATLARLELGGYLQRGPGGRYSVLP